LAVAPDVSCVTDINRSTSQWNLYGNAVHPSGASNWSMRMQIALLYPKKPKL
jgi:hypothetical protein